MKSREVISGPEVMRGPEAEKQTEVGGEIHGITEADLRMVVPEVDGTSLVLQRNAKDERNPDAKDFGALTPEALEQTRAQAKQYFLNLFAALSPEERKDVEILVVASDAKLESPEGLTSEHKRGLETAEQVINGIEEALEEVGIDRSQLLNRSEFAEFAEPEGPVEFDELEALKMFSKSPDFVQYLVEKYGIGKKFWINYEMDSERETRKAMNAEGVEDIAERMRYFLLMLARAADQRHKENPGKRLVIWAVSHYDAISPFVKRRVLDRPATDYLPVNAGGGVTLEISPEGDVKTELSGKPFDVKLTTKASIYS